MDEIPRCLSQRRRADRPIHPGRYEYKQFQVGAAWRLAAGEQAGQQSSRVFVSGQTAYQETSPVREVGLRHHPMYDDAAAIRRGHLGRHS